MTSLSAEINIEDKLDRNPRKVLFSYDKNRKSKQQNNGPKTDEKILLRHPLPVSDLGDKVEAVLSVARSENRMMSAKEELNVRYLFFEYFCQMLRHLREGFR